jgi:ubiquinone/menaquinone biosynthesis C-methylase UbiE
MSNVAGEKRYDTVFGDTFAMYSKREMIEFIEPFIIRFQRNNIDPGKIFGGKECFDGGCGNGRGSLFMLMNGAKHVTAYDFSEKNVQSTKEFAKQFGFSNIDAKQGSLADIPFEDEHFNFVWCNGVVMHTETPDRCLSESARILKIGGQSWLYIYGSGGIYWRVIYHLRELLKHINIQECMAVLKLYRYETRYIAEFIDDWYSTWVRSYTNKDLSRRLEELGFSPPQLLKYGMDYDTSHRINTFTSDEQRKLMGEGDLRYLLTKSSYKKGDNYPLKEGEYGSDYQYPSRIVKQIDPLVLELKRIAAERDWMKIAMAAFIQRELRILLNHNEPFSLELFIRMVRELISNADKIKLMV